MRKTLLVFLISLAVQSFCFAQEHGESRTRPTPQPTPRPAPPPQATLGSWIRYTSPLGRYTVALPGEPKLSTQEATSADGVKFPQYMASSSTEKAVFLIGYFDELPNTTFSFDRARDGFVQAVNGTLGRETAISLGGYPGRDFRVLGRTGDGTQITMLVRMFEIDRRVYVVQYIMATTDEDDPVIRRDANKYFDSFSVATQ